MVKRPVLPGEGHEGVRIQRDSERCRARGERWMVSAVVRLGTPRPMPSWGSNGQYEIYGLSLQRKNMTVRLLWYTATSRHAI